MEPSKSQRLRPTATPIRHKQRRPASARAVFNDRSVRGTERTCRPYQAMSVVVGKAENIRSQRVFRILPSRPREFHPEPLTDPDLILSHHPARAID